MKVARQQARVLWTHGAQVLQGLLAGEGAGGGPSSCPPKRHFLLSELQHLDFKGGYRGWRGHRCCTVELPGKVIALLLLTEGMGGRKSCLPKVFNPHPRGRIILSSICNTSFQFLLLQALPNADPAPQPPGRSAKGPQSARTANGAESPPATAPRSPLAVLSVHTSTHYMVARDTFSVCVGARLGCILRQGLPFGPGVPGSRGRAAASPCLSV